jgi:NADP-dependent 3-hydroxy acid dehydrogenase YdfG/Tfp pilus assembly protein PilF
MSKLILAYCVENQFAASKIISALSSKMGVEKVVFDAESGIRLLEKHLHSNNNPVLLLLSDNFLKSEVCMTNALRIVQTLANQKRLIPVTTEGVYVKKGKEGLSTVPTTFDRVSNVIQYMNYWQDYYLELRRNKPQGMDEGIFSEKVQKIRLISSEVGEMLRYMRAMEYFSFDQFEASNFIILYRVLGLEILPSELENAKQVTAAHLSTPIAPIVIETKTPEIAHSENGKYKHTTPNFTTDIIEIAPSTTQALDFEKIAHNEKTNFPLENLAHMEENTKLERKPITPDEVFFEKPESLDALIEEIKKESQYTPDIEDDFNDRIETFHGVDETLPSLDLPKTSPTFYDDVEGEIELPKFELKELPEIQTLPKIAEVSEISDVLPKILSQERVDDVSITGIKKEELLKVVESENSDILLKNTEGGKNEELTNVLINEKLEILSKNTAVSKKDELTLAREAVDSQHYQDAIEHLENVIETDRTNVTAYMMMAFAAEQSHDYLLSLSCLEKVTLIQPNYPNIYYKLGTLINQHFKGQKRKAVRYFSDAVKEDATNSDAYYQLAKLELENGGDFEIVITLLQDAIMNNPKHADAAFELAKAYYELGNKEKASALYERAWSVNIGYKTEINDTIFKYEPPAPEPEPIPEPEPEPVVESFNDNGMVAMITGATLSIGLAIAHIFAQHGYRLILAGKKMGKLEELQLALSEQYNNRNQLLSFDVRNADTVKEALENIGEDFKNVDILINGMSLTKELLPIDESDLSDWETLIDTHLKSVLYTTRAVAPHMVARKKGHIINLSAGNSGITSENSKNTSKELIGALTRTMREDLHKHNIQVSQIAVGAVNEKVEANDSNDFITLKTSDVAEAIFFVASRNECTLIMGE